MTPKIPSQAASAPPAIDTLATGEQLIAAAQERFLRYLTNLWIGISLVLLGFIQVLPQGPRVMQTYALSLLAAVCARLAIHWGQLGLARCILVLPLITIALVTPYWVNGIRSPILWLWPVLVILTGWFFGTKKGMALATLGILNAVVMWRAEQIGWFAMPLPLRTPDVWLLSVVALNIVTAVIVWNLLESLKATQKLEHDLRWQLSDANRALALTVQSQGQQLQETGEDLHEVRTQYAWAYPMAVMASVVPSLAHDLATPVGNARIATGTLRDHLREFKGQLERGTLRRSELDALLQQFSEGLEIVDRAMLRSADMVDSLKRLSIDQTTQRRRSFTLDELVHEVLLSLAPSLRDAGVVVEQVLETVHLDSYPGPLGQVLTNLIQNALMHAFEGRASGALTVRSKLEAGDRVLITVEDNGVGMSPAVQAQVFKAFFTTKAGQGGSGIGLTFSRELVTDMLGGSLALVSTPGQGSTFTIDIPRVAPTDVEVATEHS